jgi:ArsR family transcriptional regulator, lead/cadmium/zinc/bismuth-responsive transcriptional repressor
MAETTERPPIRDGIETCAVKGIHHNRIRAVRQAMPDPARLSALADLFKLFGDGTRIGILWALSESEMCVCDLCALLRMKQPAVSHQLKNLKQARVIKARREGKVIYYALDDEHIRNLLNLGMEHVLEA